MKEVQLDWQEFVEGYKKQKIKPWIDKQKGHALMKSPFGPRNWRVIIKLLSWLVILAIPGSIVLFFIVHWWIPVIIIVTTLFLAKAIREEALKAVIEQALKDSDFYNHAINSGTLKLFASDN